MRRMHLQDGVWAALLSTPGAQIDVIRAPDVHSGESWWKEMAGYRVRGRDRFGDLGLALGKTKDGTILLVVGGPGAMEVPLSGRHHRPPTTRTRTLVDPWGNAVGLDSRSDEIHSLPPRHRLSQRDRLWTRLRSVFGRAWIASGSNRSWASHAE